MVRPRCVDQTRTYGIHANAPCSIFESRPLGELKYPLLRGVIDGALGTSDKTPKRRAIDDGSASLLAHLLQLKLPIKPITAQSSDSQPDFQTNTLQNAAKHYCGQDVYVQYAIQRVAHIYKGYGRQAFVPPLWSRFVPPSPPVALHLRLSAVHDYLEDSVPAMADLVMNKECQAMGKLGWNTESPSSAMNPRSLLSLAYEWRPRVTYLLVFLWQVNSG